MARNRLSQEDQQRFESNVDRSGGPTACHEWTAGLRGKGYGSIRIKGGAAGAHRVAWELSVGPIPAGLHVLHHCDNPLCVNPLHLFLGTNHDNVRDRDAKGRRVGPPHPRGEAHPRAKVTADDVREIRSAGAVPRKELAVRFGVTIWTIEDILSRRSWKHV